MTSKSSPYPTFFIKAFSCVLSDDFFAGAPHRVLPVKAAVPSLVIEILIFFANIT